LASGSAYQGEERRSEQHPRHEAWRRAAAVLGKEDRDMTTKVQGKGQVSVVAQQLIAGAAKHFTNMAQLTLLGGSFTPAELAAKLQSVVTLRSEVDAAKATTQAKLAIETANMPALRALMSATVTYVKAVYGNSPDVLADFGIQTKVRVPLTVEAKVAAAAKRAATRAARHTMGKQQRKAIKGDVTGVLVTPVTAATTVVPTTARSE
jgi:hypothetical protein